MTPPLVAVQDVVKDFPLQGGGNYLALKGIDLDIRKGEFISLIGHSGCGKSTLLNMIAGLDLPTGGTVLLEGETVKRPGPDKMVVFQNYSLLPWLTCADNVHLAVERVFGAVESKTQLRARTMHALELVKLTHAADKRPNEISGGMKQRVGIARALSMEPKVLLLDEPMAGMNVEEKEDMVDRKSTRLNSSHRT